MEKIFVLKNAFHHPNLEGTVLSRFLAVYLQNKEWNVACWYISILYKGVFKVTIDVVDFSNEEFYSRTPSSDEMSYYGIDTKNETISLFLPVFDVEFEAAER